MIASQQESYDKLRRCVEKHKCYTADKGLYSQGYGLPRGHIRLWELDHKEGRAPERIDVFQLWCWRRFLRVSWTARRSNQSILRGKSTLNWRNWCWSSSILVTWWEQLTHWKSPWCWERLRAEGEEGVRWWDDSMASPMHWTWTWANSRKWWGTGRPGVPQSMGLQRSRHDWVTEQQQLLYFTGNYTQYPVKP